MSGQRLSRQVRDVVSRRGPDDAVWHDGVWHSLDDVASGVEAVDAALAEAGVGPTDPVGIYMRNRPGPYLAFAAAIAAGRPVILLSPLYPEDRVGDDVRSLRPMAVLADSEDMDRAAVRRAIDDVGSLGLEVGIGRDGVRVVADRRDGVVSVDPLDGVAVLMLTSGTTGPPKRIPLRYAEMESAMEAAQEHYVGRRDSGKPTRGQGVQILCLPPVNISGIFAMITVLGGGGKAVLMERFEPVAWAEQVAEHRPSSMSLPPAALRMVLDAKVPREQLESLRAVWVGAAPIGPALMEEFENAYGTAVLVSYGATEFSGGIAGWNLDDWRQWRDTKRGSVGRPHPGIEIAVVSPETGEEVPVGEQGIIQVRSGQTSGGTSAGWVRTSDLGHVDADGFIYIDGRTDDVINRGGFKVFPVEVEKALEEHPAVSEAVVLGIPDDRLGEVPVAAVTTCADVDPDELRAWAKQHFQSYKVPVAVHVVDEFPRNPAMKVLRRDLREQILASDSAATT